MKSKKCLIMIIAICFFMCGGKLSVEAATNSDVASYDLVNGGTQTFLIGNSLEEQVYIIVEEIIPQNRIANNTYKVTTKTSGWSAGFYIDIKSNKITRAYSPFHYVTTGKISSASLFHISYKEARYTFVYSNWLKFNTGVKAILNGTELAVSKL